MSVFSDKHIIVGVSGGIAAYKAAELVRLFIKQGAQVQVVMTDAAQEFVSALTFQALSGREVRNNLFDLEAEAGMGHIELARWADLIVVAPASANTMAKIARGMADNLLTTLCLASQAPIVVAPAMNQQMWHQHATQENLHSLMENPAISICGPASGEQACGDIGLGRMVEPEAIFDTCLTIMESRQQEMFLEGQQVLITAGPTVEDIDPVRYISNRSSGKMGYAIAQAAIDAGARVTLVSGPVELTAPRGAEVHQVRSALQMHDVVLEQVKKADIFIATAAVADYRPVQKVEQKIKKDNNQLTIELIKNPDILADVAALPDKPFTIGFAAETNELEHYAIDKLQRKNLDLIAANQVGESQGFEQDNNALYLFWRSRDQEPDNVENKVLPLASKKQLARQLIEQIALLLNEDKE